MCPPPGFGGGRLPYHVRPPRGIMSAPRFWGRTLSVKRPPPEVKRPPPRPGGGHNTPWGADVIRSMSSGDHMWTILKDVCVSTCMFLCVLCACVLPMYRKGCLSLYFVHVCLCLSPLYRDYVLLWMPIGMHVCCMYVCMYVGMDVWLSIHVCLSVWMSVCLYVRMSVCTCPPLDRGARGVDSPKPVKVKMRVERQRGRDSTASAGARRLRPLGRGAPMTVNTLNPKP